MSHCFDAFLDHVRQDGMFLLEAQLRRDGEVTDHWSRFPACPRFETYSVAKTFTAAAAGIAMEEGLIRPEDRLLDAFRAEAVPVSGTPAEEVTVQDLLTMTSGLEKTMFWRDGWERKHVRDWIPWFFENARFVRRPGTTFQYNNVNTYLLGCMIERRSGQNLREYLRGRLFEPLGIGNPEWMDCPRGHTLAANGLTLNADELGRFGQLIANGGVWEGRRLISGEYLRQMLTPHVVTGESLPGEPPRSAGYGYQIWLDTARDAVFLWGIFGQYCVILPGKNAVITVLSLQGDDGGSNGAYGVSPLRIRIWEDLIEGL
ncbi:MAG: beta-lactamase family protein [Oscillospiraceae bacterium]|nr:beta-lactamase family protein [Oscillospiraceae bacterium]